ncbi:hypothetical protein PDE_08375 [Penicillium oxalicum 114-2]|uniref:Uncharacterized protein n=1 Tax=Penicillium oxalicum (strain 114-2 / CGMCC 5302) TaxID=933388 RepID=S8B3N1_PENO1|nr:hypothetical protein PDE_08375 [Penicillium oxalicum 114-2]
MGRWILDHERLAISTEKPTDSETVGSGTHGTGEMTPNMEYVLGAIRGSAGDGTFFLVDLGSHYRGHQTRVLLNQSLSLSTENSGLYTIQMHITRTWWVRP